MKTLKNAKKKNNKGFSLVELIVVIAIMAVLIAVLAPQFTKYVDRSRQSNDASMISSVVTAAQVAASDPSLNLAAGEYVFTFTTSAELNISAGSPAPEEGDITKLTDEIEAVCADVLDLTLSAKGWKNTAAGSANEVIVKMTVADTVTIDYAASSDFAAYINK